MLGKKLHKALGSRVHVNLIPLNPTPGSKWEASPKPVQREFVRRVEAQGVPCTCHAEAHSIAEIFCSSSLLGG